MNLLISSIILAKNSEKTLANAILSVRSHVDEVIVLDTGSTDESVRIARELGAQVYSFSWNEDFSEARNASLQYVKDSDWVLVIDSDEEFLWEGPKNLRDWAKKLQFERTVVAFECFHYETNCSQLLSITHAERFFHPASFRYEGIIHERLVPVVKQISKNVNLCSYASYRHYGYSSEYHELKSQRNISLLQKAMESNPSDGLIYRYLANETYNASNYTESIKNADTALRLLDNKETYSRAQAHYYKIMALLQLKENPEAELAIKSCMEELPAYVDPYGIAAEICFSAQRWDEAYFWFKEWEIRVKQKSDLLPNHCISLIDTFREHKWIAATKAGGLKSLLRKGVQEMKLGLLIVHPQLESDWIDLLEHIKTRFEGISYEIGVWTNLNPRTNARVLDSWAERSKIHFMEGNDPAEAGAKLANECKANFIWIWNANERIISDLNEDAVLAAVTRNGAISIRSYSDRIGSPYMENRILHGNSLSMDADISMLQLAASSVDTLGVDDVLYDDDDYDYILVEKPFIIPQDKQAVYMEMCQKEAPLQQMLTAFACQNYEKVLEMDVPVDFSTEWTTFTFYRILASINLGLIEEASEMIYNAMEMDLDEKKLLDFIYLHGKLSQNVRIEEMKLEAIELLGSTLKSTPMLETKHVLTTESDWLTLIGELQWQLGDRKQAILSWRHSLESSAYMNDGCAYRLVEAVYEEYKTDGLDKVARTIVEIFNVDSPMAQSMLYPLFSYLNMTEWALLFQRSAKPSRNEVQDGDFQLVSIILPVYNDTDYLFESIRSILSQTHLELELIVVDDGSDEDVEGIVERFKYDSRLSFYKLPSNGGLPHALNFGISKAKGSIMGWTSADNYAHPRWLERMVSTISAHPNASAICSDYYHVDENGLVLETKRMPAYKLNGLQNGGPSLLWRTSSLRKSGGFDESLFGIEDRDFTIRLALAGRIIPLSEPLYYYRIHKKSLSSKIELGSLGGWSKLHEKLKRKWLYLSFV